MNRFLPSFVAVTCLAVAVPLTASAEVTCGQCGAVMHTNVPQPRCWNCGRPPFAPSPVDPQAPEDDLGPMSSGFELGVEIVPTPRGVRVTDVRPGSAADGTLFIDDIIAAAAYRDDFGRKQVLQTQTGEDLEQVKHLAGQSRTALKIRRPSGQVRYAFVFFRPARQEVRTSAGASAPAQPRAAGRIAIDNTGEAAALFDGPQDGGASNRNDGQGGDDGDVNGEVNGGVGSGVGGDQGGGGAADFFNGR